MLYGNSLQLVDSGAARAAGCGAVLDLAVSVVNFRTPGPLTTCLEALATERDRLGMHVTVVDNASNDGSAEMVRERFTWVRLIQNSTNVGFGRAHNQVLREATARHLLVLNSDAAPRPGALKLLVDYLDTHPAVAVVGPKLVRPDGRPQPSRRRFPTSATLFLESTQLQRFWPDNAVLRRYYVADQPDHQVQEVDWLEGACLCVRRQATDDVGLFDERFFVYSEELDWCRRFKASGWRIVYVPTAEVVHLEGASTQLDLAMRDRLFQQSKLRYADKWHGRGVARALRAYLVLEYVARAAEEGLKAGLGRQREERRARLRVISSGLRAALRG
jgi:GT2 family glycosyltransferase